MNSWDGISLHSSVDNILTNNTASNNGWSGIYLYSSSNNKIYNNNFIGNATQAYVDGGSSNVFNLDKPVGGNYWSNWTTPDSDGDGFVDIPFVFSGGQDNFPSVEQYHSSSIIPSRGGNAGQVSVTIFGSNFVDGTSAKLVCDSQEIIGENTVILSSHRLSTTFNLVGAPPGPCDLVVTLPDNSQFLCEDCFTVEEGGEAKLWVGIVGRDQIRPGRTVTYMVHYGNMGNLDAEEVLAFYLLDPQFEYITNSPDGKYDDFFKAVDWMLGRIPPAFTGYLNITVKVNDSVQPQTTVESFVYVVNIEPVQNQPANHNTEALIQQTSSSQVNLFLNGIDLQFGTNWARKYDEFAIRVNAAWIPVYYSGSIALDVIHVENATPGSPGFPVIPTDYNGLTQPLVVNHLYDTVFAYSGGTRTALSAIRLYNLRCKRLVLISPMSGLQSPGMYKWELEQILSQGFVQEIVIYQSENDKDLPFDNLYQVKFDQNDPWLYGKNVKVNPSNFYMDGRVVTIDEQEINKQSHGGLFLYINRRVSKGPEDQTSSSIKSTVVTELVRKNWTET